MNGRFVIHTTPGFDRLVKKLTRQHPDLAGRLIEVFAVLQTDPYNTTRRYPIKKLTSVPAGEGQYRIRSGRFRVRYDVTGNMVELVTAVFAAKTLTDSGPCKRKVRYIDEGDLCASG